MGRQGCVVLLDCRSLNSEVKPVTAELQVMICDTKAKRELTGSEYTQRRAECEAGVQVLAQFYPEVESLRDVSLAQIDAHQKDLDPVVYKRCRFIIQENQRVLDTADALAQGQASAAGRQCVESFEGARDLFEIVTPEMQAMFDAIMTAPGALGTRGAGAGFGGCLVALVEPDAVEGFTEHVQMQYAANTGITAEIYPVETADGAGELFSSKM
jgi:galactokinase